MDDLHKMAEWAEKDLRGNPDQIYRLMAHRLVDFVRPHPEVMERLTPLVRALTQAEEREPSAIPAGVKLYLARTALVAAQVGDFTWLEATLDAAHRRLYVPSPEDRSGGALTSTATGVRTMPTDGEEDSPMPAARPRYKVLEWIGAGVAVLGLGGTIVGFLINISSTMATHTEILRQHSQLLTAIPGQIGKEVAAAVAPLQMSIDHLSKEIQRVDTDREKTDDRVRDLQGQRPANK